MGVQVLVTPTPNPNSMKFTLDRLVVEGGGSCTVSNPGQASSDPLAQKLIALPGVKSLFFLNDFISVTRDPAADWDSICPKVEAVIAGHFA